MSERKEFLQSEAWLRFQEKIGRENIRFEDDNFLANGIVHTLPLVGRYLYVPRGPIINNFQFPISNFQTLLEQLVKKAKEKKCRWVRVEPETEEILEAIKKTLRLVGSSSLLVTKAPHDMQPREIFKIDIGKTEEELLAQMKSKTRYNIRLAEKRGVKVFETREEKYIDAFLDLIMATSGRKGITSHPRSYYQQFFQTLPGTMCRLFVAEYEGVVVAANIVMMYRDTATYVHGGTADVHRDVMAPYLLQWEQIKRAKTWGCTRYDFGGVHLQSIVSSQQSATNDKEPLKHKSDWSGITKFKTGFSPTTAPTLFPGAYDIILDSYRYTLYRLLRKLGDLKKKC